MKPQPSLVWLAWRVGLAVILVVAFVYETYLSGTSFGATYRLAFGMIKAHLFNPASFSNASARISKQSNVLDLCFQENHGSFGDRLTVWFSPYRQFPEVPLEGSHRAKGDYEYLAYITGRPCSNVSINYGAFKGSPADRRFSDASEQGIQAELSLARSLGYGLFVLDGLKAWVAASDLEDCQRNPTICHLTEDGFLVLRLQHSNALAPFPIELRSKRIGPGLSFEKSLEHMSISPVNPAHWHPWEVQGDVTRLRWSTVARIQDEPIESLRPLIDKQVPANLRIWLHSNPMIGSVLIEAHCSQGSKPSEFIRLTSTEDITALTRRCLPESFYLIRASDRYGKPVQRAPELSDTDSRRVFFGINYQLHPMTKQRS